MSTRCCCGKYSDVDGDGFIHNKTQHMPINTGSFCGPVDHHIIAALQEANKKLTEMIINLRNINSFPAKDIAPLYREVDMYLKERRKLWSTKKY